MKPHNLILWTAAAALVLAVGTVFFWLLAEEEAAGFPADFGFSFPGDKEFKYRLEFSAETESTHAPASLGHSPTPGGSVEGRGAIGLSGNLLVQGRGREVQSGGWYVEYRLEAVSGVEFVVQGMSVPINDQAQAEIEAGRVVVLMTPRGEITTLWFGDDTELFVRQILRPLVMELQTIIEGELSAWESPRDGYNGRAVVAYEVGSRRSSGKLSLRGSTLSYDPLRTVESKLRGVPPVIKSAVVAEIDLGGYLKNLEANETVEVNGDGVQVHSAVKVSAELQGIGNVSPNPVTPETLAGMDVLGPGEIPGEREALEDMERNRVAGYTFAKLRADLQAYGAAGEMPNHRQWLYRTVGLLLLKPETCGELAKAWFEPGLPDGAHNLIVDVLANAGNAEAQAALRDILGNKETWSHDNFQRLVQSMTLLREPNVESVEFLETLSTTVDRPASQVAAVISLGAGIGKLHARGEVAAAEKFNQTLRRLSESASTPAQRQGVLYAIGNTGMESNLGLLGKYLDSSDENTRATSARALRKLKGGDARSRLRSLAVDPSPLVQREAIRALRNNGISAEDLAVLLEGVRSGGIQSSALPGLIRALSTSLQPGGNIAEMLEALRARAGEDRDILRQINELAMELQK